MTDKRPSVRIWYENVAAITASGRRPLARLRPQAHVHGGLRLEIGGRLVPHLGYFGPDDVCFDSWLDELALAAEALAVPGGRHVYDEGEQGQPAFVFEREGDTGYFSIIDAAYSGGVADSGWQRVEFQPTDFIAAYEDFRTSFLAALRAAPGGSSC